MPATSPEDGPNPEPGQPRYRGPVNHTPYTLSQLRQQLLEAQRQGIRPEKIKEIEADIALLEASD